MADNLHNNPPAEIDVLREKLVLFKEGAAAFSEVTEGNAQEIRDHMGYGSKLSKEIDGQRDAEKRPHLEAGREIDAKYKPLVAEADGVVKELKAKLGAFLAEQERIAREKARAEAEALRKAEDEARAKAEAEAEDDPFLAATADAVEPDRAVIEAAERARLAEMEAMSASRVQSAAGGFRAAGLKTKRVAVVNDPVALAAHYAKAGNTDLLSLIDRLANADVRHAKGAPVVLPGVTIEEQRVL